MATSTKVDKANQIKSSLRWAVSATPMSTSSWDLSNQLRLLRAGITKFPNIFTALTTDVELHHKCQTQANFDGLANELKNFMTRHMKADRIGGNEALALPPSSAITVILEMSEEEHSAFNYINSS